MRISIGVTTYKRPHGLRDLIESLDQLAFVGPSPDVRIIVVDNDAEGTASATIEELRGRIHWTLIYEIEPRRGISAGRNRVIAVAGDGYDFLVFVDDDETVEPGWLEELLRVQRAHEADVVTGPALPSFPADAPRWLTSSRLMHPYRHPTGTRLDRAATNNVLIRKIVLRKMDMHFDDRLGLIGGEDTHFFVRVDRAGFRIIWADDAIVHDHVPTSRMTRRWILMRGFRTGNSQGFVCRELHGWSVESLRFLRHASWKVVRATLVVPINFILRRPGVFEDTRRWFDGIGMLVGWWRIQYKEYKHIHGN